MVEKEGLVGKAAVDATKSEMMDVMKCMVSRDGCVDEAFVVFDILPIVCSDDQLMINSVSDDEQGID